MNNERIFTSHDEGPIKYFAMNSEDRSLERAVQAKRKIEQIREQGRRTAARMTAVGLAVGLAVGGFAGYEFRKSKEPLKEDEWQSKIENLKDNQAFLENMDDVSFAYDEKGSTLSFSDKDNNTEYYIYDTDNDAAFESGSVEVKEYGGKSREYVGELFDNGGGTSFVSEAASHLDYNLERDRVLHQNNN